MGEGLGEALVSHALTWCKHRTLLLEASCLDSYISTITRLRNRGLEGEKKVMFLSRSLVKSLSRNIIGYTVVLVQKTKPLYTTDCQCMG